MSRSPPKSTRGDWVESKLVGFVLSSIPNSQMLVQALFVDVADVSFRDVLGRSDYVVMSESQKAWL